MKTGALGKVYQGGEAIVHQGEAADCLYVVQSGQAEVVQEKDGREVRLALLGEQDFLGETAILESGIRSATIRAVSEVRAITVDKKTFLRRVHEDPSLVFRVLQKMSHRIRKLSTELVRMKSGGKVTDGSNSEKLVEN